MTAKTDTTKTTGILGAREVLGAKVRDLVGEPLGTVEDLVFDPATGKISYAILAYGGLLGVGEKLFPIPLERLHWRPGDECFVLQHHGLTRDQLKEAPHVSRARWRLDLVDHAPARFSSFYAWRGGQR
jgi:hypothetical protein